MVFFKYTLLLVIAIATGIAEAQRYRSNGYLPPDPNQRYEYPTPSVPFYTPTTSTNRRTYSTQPYYTPTTARTPLPTTSYPTPSVPFFTPTTSTNRRTYSTQPYYTPTTARTPLPTTSTFSTRIPPNKSQPPPYQNELPTSKSPKGTVPTSTTRYPQKPFGPPDKKDIEPSRSPNDTTRPFREPPPATTSTYTTIRPTDKNDIPPTRRPGEPTRPYPRPTPPTRYTVPNKTPTYKLTQATTRIPSQKPTPGPGEPGHVHIPGRPYEFKYAVKDAYYGNDYSHNAQSDGDVIRGEWHVQLPDGRRQVVRYVADWATGFHPDVSYQR